MKRGDEMKDIYDFRKKYGMCVDCGKRKAIRGETLCIWCKDWRAEYREKKQAEMSADEIAAVKARQMAYQRARRAKLIEQGLCISCGKRKTESYQQCAWCRARYKRRRSA